ncbi:MAG: PAS domain S-box protein, partial [Methanomicrobiales archaeon]|nr:PAS domain S-box protein [Methanomicrobiales archaeon]
MFFSNGKTGPGGQGKEQKGRVLYISTTAPAMDKKTILIVEDEQIAAMDLKETLLLLGYEVIGTVRSGEKAVERVQENVPDLILMDIHLAGEMDGVDAAKAILSKHTVPIIYLTAYADAELISRARETRPYGYIIKPYDNRALLSEIEIAFYKFGVDQERKKAFDALSTGVEERTRELARANSELKKSEEKFRAIFNSTYQFTGLLTPDGILIEANETALLFVGVPREQVVNRPFWETPWWRGDPDRVRRLKDAVTRAAAGEFVRYEETLQGTGTSALHVDFSLKPVRDADGAVRLLIPEARDITQRKLAEEELLHEKQFSDMIIDSIPGIFYLLDEEGRFIRSNRNHKEVTGHSAEELARITALDTIAPGDRDLVARRISDVFSQGYTTVTVHVLAKDGRKIPYLLTGVSMTIGKTRYLAGTGIDISERVRAEEALRESEKKFRAIIENIQDMVYRADTNGFFTMVSPSGARLVGLDSPDQLVGRPVAERYLHPEDREAFIAALRANGSVENYPVTLKAVDGSVRHVLVSSHYYYDTSGTVQG